MASNNPSFVKVNRGAIPTWADFNALVDLVSRQKLRQGIGYLIHEGVGGTTLNINAGTNAASSIHAYTVSDASTGTTPQIRVTPGTHNGVTPTIYGTPINTKTGTPAVYPALTLGASDTIVYFQINYNSAGIITSVALSSGNTLPTSTITPGAAGSDYKLLSTLEITYAPGIGYASVLCYNDAVSGSQGYAQCGSTSNCWLT